MATKLNVRVNRKKPESMTRQIREQLNALIDAGALAAGTLLPSERELANTLDVARNVVRGAYEQLMEAGKLVSEGRKGRSVSGGSRSGGRSTAKKRSGLGSRARVRFGNHTQRDVSMRRGIIARQQRRADAKGRARPLQRSAWPQSSEDREGTDCAILER